MSPFRRLLLLLLAVFWIAGCDSSDKRGSHSSKPYSAVRKDEELRPDIFTVSPERVNGCIGLYTYDSLDIAFDALDVDKGKKIFVTVTGGMGYLRIHGKEINLRYDSAQSRASGDKVEREVYVGNNYTVILTVHFVRQEGETVWKSGLLQIGYKMKSFSVKVKGLSGC